MSTASTRTSKPAPRKPRARAKGRAVNKGPSYEPNETTAPAVREPIDSLTRYRTVNEALLSVKSDTKRHSKKSVLSKMPRAKASGKRVVFSHPAAFGEAARKYAGIVRSGVGDLSTGEGFDD